MKSLDKRAGITNTLKGQNGLPKPFYQDSSVTIYHGDARELMPSVSFPADSLITDPVWPNCAVPLFGADAPRDMLRDVLCQFRGLRLAIHLGCDSDPRFLAAAAEGRWPFFRVFWLEMARPHYKGRLMYGSDVAYFFGEPPVSRPGAHVIPGRYIDADSSGRQTDHPCPRKLNHAKQLVRWWSDEVVLDPFAGSGTTLLAAKEMGKRAIGIEIEERFCEMAANRVAQHFMDFGASAFCSPKVEEQTQALFQKKRSVNLNQRA
jgi:hypothetical protein